MAPFGLAVTVALEFVRAICDLRVTLNAYQGTCIYVPSFEVA